MNLDEALTWLGEHVNYELKAPPRAGSIGGLSLDRMRRLVEVLDEPQRQYPVVHVTGTNGKGSTARIAAAVLAEAGLQVGVYSSPHLQRVNERISRNGEPIADDDLAGVLTDLRGLVPVAGVDPSWFELMTAAAFRWFAEVAVEVAVVEVGMLGRYDATKGPLEALYGLPGEVRFCKTCVISNQRPNSAVEYQHTKESRKQTIQFDASGVCDACRLAEQKHGMIDWKDRERKLKALCDRYRRDDGHYDCIVPGSGGKDSFYAAHMLKYKYGMHPLTVTWAPHIYTDWGWRNHQSWLNAGFDNYLCTPNPRIHRLLTRLAVENLFHPFQAFMFGQKSLAPKMALLHDIPLVFYGDRPEKRKDPDPK